MPREYLFTSESVTEGHPDKICDRISDSILDAILTREIELEAAGKSRLSDVRVAVESFVTTGLVVVGGEVRTNSYVDVDTIVRKAIDEIGYNDAIFGFDAKTCGVLSAIHGQSDDIALGVDASRTVQDGSKLADELETLGAGDQGMVFGYACNETKALMPLPIHLAHRLSERLTYVRKEGILPYLRPDGKTQVSVKYVDGKPVGVEKLLISTQTSEIIGDNDAIQNKLKPELIEEVIKPVFEAEGFELPADHEIYINPTGRFVIGGPMGDSGLTGRKIIVDTYGGYGRHGGGAFSGKDCTKVDRSAAYAARWVAKNIVAAGLADRCEIQIAYAIGVAAPLSILVDTFGTEKLEIAKIEEAVSKVFDLRPAAIIRDLDLRRPIYKKTSAYGHFGREDADFTWEQTNRVEELKAALAQ